MISELKILFVEDLQADAELIKREIKKSGIDFTGLVVDTEEDYINGLNNFNPDLILSDYSLPGFDGMQALKLQRELVPLTPFVLVTGSVNEETAVECMKAGADDYVIKQNLRRLGEAIKGAIEKKRLIAEMKEVESTLRRSEEQYRSLFENSAIPILEEDFSQVKLLFDELKATGVKDFRLHFDKHPEDIIKCTSLIKIININQETLRFFQAKDKQQIISDLSPCFMDETWAVFKEEIIALSEGKQYFEAEIQLATYEWEHRNLIIKLSVHPECVDTLKQVLVSFIDITASKQAEAALAESEELFRTAYENATVGVCLVNSSGDFLSVNNALCNFLGYSMDELLTLTLSEITLEEDKAIAENFMKEMLSSEISIANFENRFIHKNNSIIWANVSTGIIRNSTRRIEYFVTYIEDITKRKEAEITIRKSVDLYSTLTENMKDVIWIIDPEKLSFIYVSPSSEKMIGFTNEELMQMPVDALIDPEFKEKLMTDIKKVVKEDQVGPDLHGKYHTQVIKQPCKDGSFIWAEITSYVFLNKETGKLELRGVHRDMTEQRNAEELLRKSEQKFRLLYENAPDPIQILDRNLCFIDCNEATLKMFGANEKSQILSLSLSDISPDNQPNGGSSSEKLFAIVNEAFDKGFVQFEWVHKRFDEKLLTIDINLSRVTMDEKDVLLVHMRDLTARKVVEERLRENEEKFRLLAENSTDVIWTMDINAKNTYISPAVERLRGYTPEEALEQSANESLTPDSILLANKFLEEAKQLIYAGKRFDSYNLILEHTCREGSTVWVEVTISGIYDEKGNFVSFLGVTRDISERKSAEDALRESEEKFRLLAENSTDVIWTMDLQGTYTYVSPSVEKLRGYKAEEVLTQGIAGSLTSRSFNEAINAFNEAYEKISSGEKIPARNFIFEQSCKDGSSVWTEITMSGIWNESNQFVCYLGVTRDITERKKAEELLQDRQFWLSESQRVGKIGSYSLDIEGNKWSSSEVLDEIFGITAASSKTIESWLSLVVPDQVEEMSSYFQNEILQKHQQFNKEYRIIRQNDGVERWVWGLGELVFNAQGKNTKMIGTIQDITDRKRSEEALIAAKEKAVENDRLKTAFLNNISHEIRTPMNAIVGFSGFLNEPNLQADKRKYFTEIICNASTQLLSIITDIINIATIETGQESVNKTEFNLNKVLTDVFKQFEVKANNQHLNFKCNTPLPDDEVIISTDETKFIQILSNLIGNSLKFTRQGKIEFGYSVKDDFLEFFVTDTGIGIPEKMHSEIFERFRQADSTIARQFGGTGLGLSISKAYVELLGGTIRLTSEPGQGSTFFFTIPYKVERKSQAQEGIDLPGNTLGYAKSRTILVAEDEDFNFMLLEQILSGLNLNLIRVLNGAEAVMTCKSKPEIDMVVMDVKMPVMDGYEATRLIKLERPDLPIIIQTAYVRESDKLKAFESGCDEYISKPIVVNDFLRLLDKHFTEHELA